jgi:hypothetical protein
LAAKKSDLYYHPDAGDGGLPNAMGSNGYCVALVHDLYKTEAYTVKGYFYTGADHRITIPALAQDTGLLTFKCWGEGSGD